MNFLKMHGLGNDFVILDHRNAQPSLSSETIKNICDRRRGVGCDQLILMESSEKADLFMRIYNPDGSQSEACGNATRCVAHLYMKEAGMTACTIQTLAGALKCRLLDHDLVEVDMGPPLEIRDLTFDSKSATFVSMGNPHCVFFVKDAESIPLSEIGPSIEHHEEFPNRTNVEFAQVNPDGSIRLRVWERGAGITQACGSGACAAMVAAAHGGLTGRNAEIRLDGGPLSLHWREPDNHVLMTGPVVYVFAGTLT